MRTAGRFGPTMPSATIQLRSSPATFPALSILAAELEHGRGHIARALLKDFAPTLRAASEDDLAHLGMLDNELPDRVAGTRNDIHRPGRGAGPGADPAK